MFPVSRQHCDTISWNNHGILASGGVNYLSIFDYTKSSLDQIQQHQTRNTITSLAWSNFSEGLLAVGSDQGLVSFWNSKTLSVSDESRSILKEDNVFRGSKVEAMQFCKAKPNLLAVGGSEVFIINVEQGLHERDQSKYTFKPGKNPQEHRGGAIADLAWNPEVNYILAANSYNGITAVWDLRNTRTLFNVHDPAYFNKSRCSALAWNPEIPTQFVLCYEDSTNPCIQVWDLRNHEYPVQELNQHHKQGVVKAGWCPYDSSLFASTDKAGFSVIWNFKQGQMVNIVDHNATSSLVDMQWVQHKKGVLSVVDDQGNLEITSIYNVGVSEKDTVHKTSSDNYNGLKQIQTNPYTPNWLQSVNGSTVGYGKLVQFNSKSAEVKLIQVPAKQDNFNTLLAQAETYLNNGQWSELAEYMASNLQDKKEWKLLQGLLTKNVDSLLAILGIDKETIASNTEKFTGKKVVKAEQQKGIQKQVQETFAELSAIDAVSFFDKVGQVEEQKSPKPDTTVEQFDFKHTITETISKNINWDEGAELLIKQNLILNNIQQAIDCALMCGRTTEALIISEKGGQEMYEKTKETIISRSKDQYLKNNIIPMLNSELANFVERSDLERWNESLAVMLVHGDSRVLSNMTEELGGRLQTQNGAEWATLACYMIGGNFNKVLDIWIEKSVQSIRQNKRHYEQIILNLFFKSFTLKQALGVGISIQLENILKEFILILQSRNLMNTCYNLLKMFETAQCTEFVEIKYRILVSLNEYPRHQPWEQVSIQPQQQKQYAPEQRQSSFNQPPNQKAFNKAPPRNAPPQPPKQRDQQKTTPNQPISSPFSNNTEAKSNPFPTQPVHIPTNLMIPSPLVAKTNDLPPPPTQQPKILPPPPTQQPSNFPPTQQPANFPPTQQPTNFPPTQQPNNFPPTSAQSDNPPMQQFPKNQLNPTPKSHYLAQPSNEIHQQSNMPQHTYPTDVLPQQNQQVFNQVQPVQKVQDPVVPKVKPPSQEPRKRVAPPPRAPPAQRGGPNQSRNNDDSIDISKIGQDLQPLAQEWLRIIEQVQDKFNPRIKRFVISNISKLFEKMEQRTLDSSLLENITQLAQLIQSGDQFNALQLHKRLTETVWGENSDWLNATKNIIQSWK